MPVPLRYESPALRRVNMKSKKNEVCQLINARNIGSLLMSVRADDVKGLAGSKQGVCKQLGLYLEFSTYH